MSPTLARIAGFVPLVCLGVLEWTRLSAHEGAASGLAWVAVAVGAMVALVAAERLPRRSRPLAFAGVTAGAVVVGALVAGLDPTFFKPRHWDELANGLTRGAETLSSVRLPYAGADPWPQLTLDVVGALLCVLAGLLAAWPRASGRGFPFFAWAVLLVLVVSPVVSLGGGAPVILGVALAVMSIVFLWLERLPLRPGLAAAALGAIVLAGALPLGAAADRNQPWFDYRSFAEGLGPVHPEHFAWDHDYGPIAWPRDGRELFRVKSAHAQYWKAETLDTFDGERWRAGGPPQPEDAEPTADLAPDWTEHPEWGGTAQVTITNLRSTDVVGPGTILNVSRSTRHVDQSVEAGRWMTTSELRKGDSYRIVYQAPRPSRAQLQRAGAVAPGVRARELTLHVARSEQFRIHPRDGGLTIADRKEELPDADVAFPPFGSPARPVAVFPTLGRSSDGGAALRRSRYARTWALVERLKRNARTPMQYVLNIDAYLENGFRYTENPPPPAPGREPLDAFLIDGKAGYCQHFSGAMAILLRMGGIPARVATGFTAGGYQKRSGEWVVRDTDAHSWVEAWFDGIGWVTLDPTPPGTPARSQIAAIRPQNASPDSAAQANSANSQDEVSTGTKLKQDANEPAGQVAAGGGAWPGWPVLLLAAAAVLAVAVAVFRRRRFARMAPETALSRAIAELQVALRRLGFPTPPGTTLAQVERRLHLDGDAAAYVRSLRTSRYGRRPTVPTVAQRRALRRQLAQGSGLAGRARSLWALPPWRR